MFGPPALDYSTSVEKISQFVPSTGTNLAWDGGQVKFVSLDDITVAQLKEAIDSHGGVKDCCAAVYELHQAKQMLTPVKWTGISQLNNSQYEYGSIKMWHAFPVRLRSRINALPMESTQQMTGHDDTTVAQLKEAIDSYGGVKDYWAAVCELHQA
ncbi:hypothetical protein AWC38_SpisGene24732 [Stylophora pistillata]|uniref:Uncharacterized protein n=1 Tax=Stylophora pistillata TaxID=50429 RepID=A0A2B4R2Y0_STYPI|nr:hypothetical protein AWC38_SpisGene24732 [Stylophora pistillata]